MAVRIVLICIFCILLVAGILQSATIGQFSGVSLRYNTPICGQTAYRARQYSVQNSDSYNPTFWPTFWHQCSATFRTGIRTSHATVISFSGDAMLVWPAEYLTGSAPGILDGTGVAISKTLAHRLWGSINVIGMRVYVNNTPRTVRGVFAGDTDMALLSFDLEDTSQSFTAIELSGDPDHPTRADADSFAIAAGLGRPCYILMSGPMSLARLMAFFPLLIPAVYLLVLVFRFMKKHYPTVRVSVFFAGLLLFAVVLPVMLDALPPWLIPTRFGDFSFWGNLINQAGDSLHEFLSVNPMLRDVELRMHLLRQTLIFMLTVCSGIVLVFNTHQRHHHMA